MSSSYTFELTAEQQDSYEAVTGVRRRPLTLSRRQLMMLALAGAARGSEVLPLTRTPELIPFMLEPGGGAAATGPFIVWVRLTAEQAAQVRALTGRSVTMAAIAPDEWGVSYSEDWADFEPFMLGHRIRVVEAGSVEDSGPQPDTILLPRANGRGAFGTGRHSATVVAALNMEDTLRPGDHVLDVGTGSGILAIAAVRLGAARALGVDVEPEAIACAAETIALNEVQDRVRVVAGSIEAADSEYDVIVMNIFPQVITALAPSVPPVLRRGGRVITSGVTAPRVPRLTRAMNDLGFAEQARREDCGWVSQVYILAGRD